MSNLIDAIVAAVHARILADLNLDGATGARATSQPTELGTKPGTPVVVTSTTRDIWFGYAVQVGDVTVLDRARHCYYYAAPNGPDKGIGSLASVGPTAGSKIGGSVRRVTIRNTSGVLECDEKAVAAWESSTWGG